MTQIKLTFTAIILSVIYGCASVPPQPSVDFSSIEALKDATITIAMTEVPSPKLSYPGADCLLCQGVASAMSANLSSHIKTLPNDDLKSLGQDLQLLLEEKGLKVTMANAPFSKKGLKKSTSAGPNIARTNYTGLKDQYDTSHLLVIDISRVGAARNFSSYVPSGAPYIIIAGTAYLVNLETNTYDWYMRLSESNHAEGNWKEPTDYPSLTNTYYESVERIREEVLNSISSL